MVEWREVSNFLVASYRLKAASSDESVEDFTGTGQMVTVKSICLTPRSDEFIRHLKKEKERQRRQEISIHR